MVFGINKPINEPPATAENTAHTSHLEDLGLSPPHDISCALTAPYLCQRNIGDAGRKGG